MMRWLVAVVIAAGAIGAQAGVNEWTITGPEGASMAAIAVHPTRSAVLIASSLRGLYRSEDGGASWTLVRNDLAQAEEMVFDPGHPDDAYVAWGAVYRSTDAGLTFARSGTDSPIDTAFVSIATDGVVFAAGRPGGVYRSADRGQTWTTLTHPWPDQVMLSSLALDPNNPAVLYVTVDEQGTYKSVDRGATWTGPAAGSPGTNVGVQTPHWVWTFAVQPGNSNRLVAGTSRGILFSNDAGATWNVAAFFELAFWIGFDPANPSRVIGFGNAGVLRSVDGGATWPQAQVGAQIHSPVYGAAIDPSAADRLWAAGADGPILSSNWGTDVSLRAGGIHAGSIAGFSASSDGTIYALGAFGPRGLYRRGANGWQALNNTAMYDALPSIVQLKSVSTTPQLPGVIHVANYFGGLTSSHDGGNTWSPAAAAFQFPTPTFMSNVAADPTSTDAKIAYATTSDRGVWKTIDGGGFWAPRSNGLPAQTEAVTVDPADGNTVYVGGGDQLTHTLYKSLDGGSSWTATAATSFGAFSSFTIDPANSNVVYACGNSAQRSRDGGATWSPLDFGPHYGTFSNTRTVLIDPVFSDTLFAVGGVNGNEFMRSVDGGLNWEQTQYPLPAGSVIFMDAGVLDPLQPNVLIANAGGIGIVEYEVATDLSVSLAGITAPIATGGAGQVTIKVSNLGPHAASPAQVQVTLPDALSATLPPTCSRSGASISCQTGPILNGNSQDISLPLAANATPASGAILAGVAGHERDPVASNNHATLAFTTTEQADLELALSAAATTIDHGTSTTLTAAISNHGPSASSSSQLVLQIPAGLTVQSATASAGTCTLTTDHVACALGTLAKDANASVTLSVTGATVGSSTISGAASGAGTDSDTDQNAMLALNVRPVGDVGVELADSADPVTSGTQFQYTATVRNFGPDEGASKLTVEVTGATVASVTTLVGTCNIAAAIVSCDLNSLANAAAARVMIDVTRATAGDVSAKATVVFAGTDPVVANNGATASTAVNDPPPPPPPPPASGGGGGGGGGMDWLAVLLLGMLLAPRLRRE